MEDNTLQTREPEVLQRRDENQVTPTPVFTPRGDVFETAAAVVLVLDVPGARQDQVEVTLEHDLLTVTATPNPTVREGYTLAYREYVPGTWRREFRISAEVDRDRITARVREGVLTVTVPKAEAARRHKIPVQGS